MTIDLRPSAPLLPFKSVAAALLFSAVLGPLGLLYASFWAGLCMILLAVVVISSKLFIPILLLWVISCILAVYCVESYNKKLLGQ
jgi:hypothetical protein